MTIGRPGTVLQGGRAKAYRPLSLEDRTRAIEAGLEAYERGDFFEAHELLEPAWMGTDRLAERELVQGLIKIAAAYVHATRRNPRGVEKNLRGARERLAESIRLEPLDRANGAPLPLTAIDRTAILADLDRRLVAFDADQSASDVSAAAAARSFAADGPPRIHRIGEAS